MGAYHGRDWRLCSIGTSRVRIKIIRNYKICGLDRQRQGVHFGCRDVSASLRTNRTKRGQAEFNARKQVAGPGGRYWLHDSKPRKLELATGWEKVGGKSVATG